MPPTTDNLLMRRFLAGVDKRRGWLFAGLAVLYLVAFNGQLRITDDNCYYTRVGINLAEGRGYSYHGKPDTIAFPGVPVMVALGQRIAPGDAGLAITHGLLLAMGLGTLVASYYLFQRYTERSLAVLGVVILGCTRNMHEHSFRMLTDGPFAFAVVVTLLGYALATGRKPLVEHSPFNTTPEDAGPSSPQPGRGSACLGYGLLTLGLSLAAVSRVMVMALALSLGLVCLWRVARGPSRVGHLLIGVITVGVIAAFYVFDPRRPPEGYTEARTYEAGLVRYLTDLGPVLHRSLTEFVPMLFDDAASAGLFGLEFDPITNTLLSIGVLTLAVIGAWRKPLWIVFLVVIIAVMLVFTPHRRYFLPVLPIVCLGVAQSFRWMGLHTGLPWRRFLPGVLLTLVLTPNLIKCVDLIIEQRSTPFLKHYRDGKYESIVALGEALPERVGREDLVLSLYASQLTLYSDGLRVVGGEQLSKRKSHEQVAEALAEPEILYVVKPMGEDVQKLISDHGLTLGPKLLELPNRDPDSRWTLHTLMRPEPTDTPDSTAAEQQP